MRYPSLCLSVSHRKGQAPLRPRPEHELVPDGLASQPTLSRLAELKGTLEIALSCAARSKTHYRREVPRHSKPPRSADQVFAANEATLLLYGWGYNLANQLRRVANVAMPLPRGSRVAPEPAAGFQVRVAFSVDVPYRDEARVAVHGAVLRVYGRCGDYEAVVREP